MRRKHKKRCCVLLCMIISSSFILGALTPRGHCVIALRCRLPHNVQKSPLFKSNIKSGLRMQHYHTHTQEQCVCELQVPDWPSVDHQVKGWQAEAVGAVWSCSANGPLMWTLGCSDLISNALHSSLSGRRQFGNRLTQQRPRDAEEPALTLDRPTKSTSLEEKAPVILFPGSEEEISVRGLLLVSPTTAEVKRSPHTKSLDLMAAPRANTTHSHNLLQHLHRSSPDSLKPEHVERLEASAKGLEAAGCRSEDLAFLHCCGPSGSSSTSLLIFKH